MRLLVAFFVSILLCTQAFSASAPKRPLIFIPGVLGSKLIRGDSMLWGTDVIASLRNFSKLEFKDKSEDLSIKSGKPDCLIDAANIILFPIDVYESLIKYLYSLGYDENNLIVFCYDWRHSIFDSADKLNVFINSQQALANGEFDVLMHSMGGLIGRDFLHKHKVNAERVKNYIEVTVPHKGSVSTLIDLYDGWGTASRVFVSVAEIRKAAWSFDSIYELMPTYENCCGRGFSPPNTPKLNFKESKDWEAIRWLFPTDVNVNALSASGAERLVRLDKIMSKPWPQNLRHYHFAGTGRNTAETVYVLPSQKKLRIRESTKGDETVHKESGRTLNDIPYPTFAKHRNAFFDQGVMTVLRDILLSDSPVQNISGTTPQFADKDVLAITSNVSARFADPDSTVKYSFELELSSIDKIEVPVQKLLIKLGSSGATLAEIALAGEQRDNRIIYSTSFSAPANPGLYTLAPSIDQLTILNSATEGVSLLVVPKS